MFQLMMPKLELSAPYQNIMTTNMTCRQTSKMVQHKPEIGLDDAKTNTNILHNTGPVCLFECLPQVRRCI